MTNKTKLMNPNESGEAVTPESIAQEAGLTEGTPEVTPEQVVAEQPAEPCSYLDARSAAVAGEKLAYENQMFAYALP